MATVLRYGLFEDVLEAYSSTLVEVAKEVSATAVAELGGGAEPLLDDEEVWGFVPTRVVYDIDPDELAKAPGRAAQRVADLCQPLDVDAGRYDLVFSRMLGEHLTDPEVFHRNCFHLLRPGGASVHFFPTLYALPFTFNRIVPEGGSRLLIRLLQPGRLDDPKHRKFPAHYRWCRGPTRRSVRRFAAVGFDDQEWRVCFGHSYYRRLPPLQALEDAKARALVRRPVRWLSSFVLVILRKPATP